MNKDQIPVDSSSKIEVDQNELFDNFNTTTLEDEVESAKTEFRLHATDEAVSLLADVKDELEAQGEATVSKTRQRVTEVATGVAKDAAYEMEAKKTAAVKDFERQVSELTGTEIAAVERMKSYDGGGVSASNKEFQRHLLQHYERRHSCLALPPLFPDADANLESFYVPPRIDVIRKRGGRRVVQGDGQVQCFKDIFFHDNEALKDVFIQGESGIGKSSFCAKIIHSWCKAHNSDDTTMRKENVQFFHDYDVLRIFDYLFFVSLRDSSEYECDIDRMILHQVVNYLPNSQMYCDTFLQGILAGKRCLILLDGLDEWAHPDRSLHKCGCKPKTPYPFRRTRNNCTVVSTTRQWYLAKHPVRDSEMGLLLQISGITDTSVLINKVLGCLDEKFGERPLVEDFDKVVSRNQLENLMAIPLMCMQLLCLWFEGRLDCKSHAQIYSSMVDMLFGRVHEKKGVSDYDSVPVPLYEPRLDADEELPDFFADDLNIIANKSLFFSLCRLAYHTLVDWLGCSSGIFEGRAVLDNLTGIEWSAALEVGILTQKQSQNVLTTRRTTYSFLHRTIQEFLSAVHIVCVGKSREEREQMIVDIGDESLSKTKKQIRVFVHDLAD